MYASQIPTGPIDPPLQVRDGDRVVTVHRAYRRKADKVTRVVLSWRDDRGEGETPVDDTTKLDVIEVRSGRLVARPGGTS